MTEQNFEQMRRAMVASQLRTTGVNDPRVVAAMGAVPRERFVPADRCALAYADALVPVGHGRELNPPMALGRLLTEARLRGDERALVIGAATGYSAAVLARLVRSVVAVEDVPPAIVEQIADGGEVALALIEDGVTRLCVGRVAGGAFGTTAFSDAAAAVLPGFDKPRGFSF